jgi:hypothetical protein
MRAAGELSCSNEEKFMEGEIKKRGESKIVVVNDPREVELGEFGKKIVAASPFSVKETQEVAAE